MSSDSNIHGNYSVQISPKKSEISRQYVKSMIDDFRSTASILRCEGIRSPMNDKDGNDIEVVSHTFLNSQIDELNESDCDI